MRNNAELLLKVLATVALPLLLLSVTAALFGRTRRVVHLGENGVMIAIALTAVVWCAFMIGAVWAL